jgi:tRNA(adenine34) deaminase
VVEREQDEKFMRMALEEAQRAGQKGEIPVGALLIRKGQVLARAHNRCIELSDPTAHAEILALRRAGERLGNYRLNDTVMYVTIEPCPMCVAAMIHGRISRLIFGASEPKFGAIESKFKLLREDGFNHHFEVTRGVLETECGEVLRSFFKKKRTLKKKVRSREFACLPAGREFGVKSSKARGSKLNAHRYKVTG